MIGIFVKINPSGFVYLFLTKKKRTAFAVARQDKFYQVTDNERDTRRRPDYSGLCRAETERGGLPSVIPVESIL